MRISDAERQKAIDRLRRHCAAGRLDIEEYASRLEGAMTATTFEELDILLADLPMISVPGPAGFSANGSSGSRATGPPGGQRQPGLRNRLTASAIVLLSIVVVGAAVGLALAANWIWALVLLVGWLTGLTQGRLTRR